MARVQHILAGDEGGKGQKKQMDNKEAADKENKSDAAKNKAVAHDMIYCELLRAAPQECAELMHPLMIKMSLFGREPLMAKRARAAALFKGSESTRQLDHFRSILSPHLATLTSV